MKTIILWNIHKYFGLLSHLRNDIFKFRTVFTRTIFSKFYVYKVNKKFILKYTAWIFFLLNVSYYGCHLFFIFYTINDDNIGVEYFSRINHLQLDNVYYHLNVFIRKKNAVNRVQWTIIPIQILTKFKYLTFILFLWVQDKVAKHNTSKNCKKTNWDTYLYIISITNYSTIDKIL